MNTSSPLTESGPAPWTVMRGPATPERVLEIVREVAARHGATTEPDGDAVRLTTPDGLQVLLRWKPLPPQPPRTLGYQTPSPPALEILIDSGTGTGTGTGSSSSSSSSSTRLAADLHERLAAALLPYTRCELDGITTAMPLVRRYSTPDSAFDGWALLFRDHYLEHSVGFLLGMERAGIPAEWIYALDKGDRTAGRDRIRATFRARGYRTGLLDNTAINNPQAHAEALSTATEPVDAFLDAAHAAGRRVLVIDDGGLLTRGYGAAGAHRRADAALELTVSGIKRINSATQLDIPVLNLARSQVKTLLGYREIADSCLRRLRTLLPDRKLIGRPVLLLGYGTLGSRLAAYLRALGCRVTVVDTAIPALIDAAETGYTTYRTAAQALNATSPTLVIGTTGETALTTADLAHLTDGTVLAPFATRDFSTLTTAPETYGATEIPSVGIQYHLEPGRAVTLLGNGRSANLFEDDSIPPQGYDAYRAGTLIAARHLCADPARVPVGLHTRPADEVIAAAGLFEAYYDLYAAQPTQRPTAPATLAATPRLRHACVIGYGNAGRLHTNVFSDLAATVTVIDPKHQHLPKSHRPFPHDVAELPASVAADIDLWSICCPTGSHLAVIKAVLSHNPAARILLEKPAVQGDEIDAFTTLLTEHPAARLIVNDQYAHSTTLSAFTSLINRLEPEAPINQITVTFTKDRTKDIAQGRFIDRAYGVLGYEWLHMLTVLSHITPAPAMDTYLAADPTSSELWATYDPRLFVSALTERTTIQHHSGPVHLELASSILGPSVLLGRIPGPRPPWRQDIRPADDRHRHVAARAGKTLFTLHLEPVTALGGWQLDRNHHRLTATRAGRVLHDEVLRDSPLETSIHDAVTVLLSGDELPSPKLAPLRRIASLAATLRGQAPLRTPDVEPRSAGASRRYPVKGEQGARPHL